jgi:hypothetical protein
MILHREVAGGVARQVAHRVVFGESQRLRVRPGLGVDHRRGELQAVALAVGTELVRAHPQRRRGVEPEPEPRRLPVAVPLVPPLRQPLRPREPGCEIGHRVGDRVGEDRHRQHAEPRLRARVERQRRGAGRLGEPVGHQVGDAAEDAVDEPGRLRQPDVGGERHGLVHRGVLGDVREERELERPEVEHVPQAVVHGARRPVHERADERVERGPAADDAEHQLRDEPPVLRRQREAGELVVDQVGDEPVAADGAVEDVGRGLSGGQDSTSGPNSIPGTTG